MEIKLVIPARYKSSRFPGKPLAEIAGTPMIRRVYEQCSKAFERTGIYVATDSPEISAYCTGQGIQVVMTSEHCLTGTDRVAEVAQKISGDIFINVQGDEPVFNPEDIQHLLEAVEKDPDKVYAGFTAITSEEELRNTSVPKIVFSHQHKLLYTSRSPIPGNKKADFRFGYRQVCAYAFPRKALEKFTETNAKGPLEKTEDLELLRFLELDFPVYMVQMSAQSIPVDHPEDVAKVEAYLQRGQ